MKKYLLAISVFAAFGTFSQLNGQIVYSEDFDGVPGPTAGGAGTYTMAPGMLLRNVDNRTPDANVAYVNEAWERREDFNFNVADSCAFSTSWYVPAGAANDFMWTPLIGPLPANSVLSWNGVTYDPLYPDGYEVRIMTVAPTGGTGVIGNQLTNSTVIFSTAAEATAWTSHSVNLNAYAGQSVYIGFRNNSNDKFILLIDDIIVQVQLNIDAELLSTDTMSYTIEPQSQRTANMISGVVRNNGSNALTNVQLNLTVFDGTMTQVYTATSPALPSLASSATATLTVGSYTPPATPDFYTYQYTVTQSGVDQVPANDVLIRGVLVDDSIYARDDGTVTAALGIGAGNGGYLGQQFEVVSGSDPVTSVSMYITVGYPGRRAALAIWDMAAGVPNQIVALTDTIIYPDDSARLYTIMMDGGPFALTPGQYVVTAIEFPADSTLQVGQTNSIFRNGTTWVNWPTNPLGGWANNEDFGAGFAKAYVIRPNFGNACAGFMAMATSTDATCGACTDGTATVTLMGGSGPYTYSWAPSGGTAATATNLAMGTYTVTATGAFGCVTTATVTVGNNCTSFSAAATSTDASCGGCNDGTATATTTNGTGPYTYAWSNGDTGMMADSLLPGTYTVTVTDAAGCSSVTTVVVNFSTGMQTLGAAGSVGVYPNPSEGDFTLYVNLPAATDVQIEIVNSLGQRVYSNAHLNYSGGQLPIFIDTPGMYTVKVSTADGIRVMPVMIK
jgi:hypothetical protein